MNYNSKLHKINTISSLNELGAIWQHTPYGKPSKLFFNIEQDKVRSIQVGEDTEVVEEVCFFLSNSGPKWEFDNNGGCIRLDINPNS